MRRYLKLNISRLLALCVVAALVSAAFVLPTSAAESGKCGADLTWSYTAGTLTLSGTGDMTNYTEDNMAPWYAYADEIRRVIMPDGITSIGKLAFYGCENLSAVNIPDTVLTIGELAFAGCSSLSMIDIGPRVSRIGNSAFYGCTSLHTVRLPYGLLHLGDQAFYRCESLLTVTIYSDLSTMGHSVFAYCKSLMTAKIEARLTSLPEWTFYGCEKLMSVSLPDTITSLENYSFKNCDALSTVYYGGEKTDPDQIKQQIVKDVDTFSGTGVIGPGDIPADSYFGKTDISDNGDELQQSIKLNSDEDSTVSSVIVHERPASGDNGDDDGDTYTADFTVTIENDNGWDTALPALEESLQSVSDAVGLGVKPDHVSVTVYMKDGVSPDEDFIKSLSGRDLKLKFVDDEGSSWQLDCSEMKDEELSGNYSYSYTLSELTSKLAERLGTDRGYIITFAESAEIDAEVIIQLPSSGMGYSNAYLYQVEKNGELTRLQAVMVDINGAAHFYLASVKSETQYVLGLNVPGESTEDVILPEIDDATANAIARVEQIEYVVTGVDSSWGLSFGQVTLIMVGALVFVIIVVGIVMGSINKQRVKAAAASRR